MHLSNRVLKTQPGSQDVLEFVLPRIEMGVPGAAMDFVEAKARGETDFKMSDSTRMLTGVDQVEEKNLEDIVELKVLQKLEAIQKSAFDEAHQLGLIEGRREAFSAASLEIQEHLKKMGVLAVSLQSVKEILLKQAETHLIKLLLHMAGKLAQHEVTVNTDALVSILKSAVETAQSEEQMIVHVNPEQLKFFEQLRESPDYDLEFMKKVKIVPQEGISLGGCVVETNFGEVDSRIEERIKNLWTTFSDSLFPIKDRIQAA